MFTRKDNKVTFNPCFFWLGSLFFSLATASASFALPLSPGDRISVSIPNETYFARTYEVNQNGAIEVPITAVPWFNCLGIKKENFPVVGLDLPVSSFTNGLLGMDFLREVKAVIDVAKGEIQLGN